jgi:hypothetical protein
MKRPDIPRIAAVGLSMLLALASVLYAIPQTINYQGLLEEDGVLVDGSRDVTFRIYDGSQGGSVMWEEEQTVIFVDGVFSVLLGGTEPIPTSVFDGGRRWLSVSVDGGPEILPRAELVSVGYAFHAASADTASHALTADDAASAQEADVAQDAYELGGAPASQYSRVSHTHDSWYYRQNQLNTSDDSDPNVGANRVHWDILTGVPEGFADGEDNTGAGPTDHGQLTGLLDNDHPQYALGDSLRISDGTQPNTGRNMVHWNVLTGVPAGFVDGIDNVTTDASAIVTGTMSPQRIQGVAVVSEDPRLLTTGQKSQLTGGGVTTLHSHDASQIITGTMAPERIAGIAVVTDNPRLLSLTEKNELTGGGTTSLHSHVEIGDISSLTAGEGLAGGGQTGDVEVSHAADATSLPFAHHTPPFLTNTRLGGFATASSSPTVVISDSITVPAAGFLYVTFSATQKLDTLGIPTPPYVETKRYFADYGIGVDQASTMDYRVRSSVTETNVWFSGVFYVPSKSVTGSVVLEVGPGQHEVYFLTRVAYAIDSGARSRLEDISLTAVYFEYDTSSMEAVMLMSGSGAGRGRRGPSER